MFVITGVSGNTGSVVAEELLAKGERVRVVVRDAAKGEAWKGKGAEVAVASLDDAEALAKAFEGAKGAYVLSPPDAAAADFLALRRKTIDAVAEAVVRARVPHVVLLSSVAAHRPDGTGPILSVRYGELRLAKTGAALTSVRAAYFVENWAAVLGGAASTGKLASFLPADLSFDMVSTRDIGLTAARALLEGPRAPGAKDVIELAGPRALTPNDIASAVSRVVGKPVAVEVHPTSAVVPTFVSFGFSENVAGLYREMLESLAAGRITWEGGAARFVRGSIPAEDTIRALLGK